MNWGGVWHLGIRYLRRNRAKTSLLVAAFTLVWFLPVAVGYIVGEVEEEMRARAADTPLVLGRTGSPLELVFNGVYFTKPEVKTLTLKEAQAAAEIEGISMVPLYARFSTNGFRIVGTNLDYPRFRGLKIKEGRQLIHLGECMIGSRVAKDLDASVGDSLISSPETIFDLAGVYPLKMRVVGVMAPTGTPDDRSVFVDLRTTWIIEGLGHGHQEAEKTNKDERLASEKGSDTIVLNASVVKFNEITPENADSFHFHGDEGDNPITAAILIPEDAKAQAIAKGRYANSTELQLVSPKEEMDELFSTVFRVQRLVTWLLVAIGVATILIGTLVFLLSYRLRITEFSNLRNMGADPGATRALVLFEAVFVVCTSLLLGGGLLAILASLTPAAIRAMLG